MIGRRWALSLLCAMLLELGNVGWGPVADRAARASEIRFSEASAAWGLVFRHHNGASGRLFLMETFGSGVVLFDYDGDGDVDVLFVDSGALPGYEGPPGRTVLYRNEGAMPARGDGAEGRAPSGAHFLDVTAAAGIDPAIYGMGGVSGDVDGDGDLDLYLTSYGANVLYRNDGDGTFADATRAAGVGEERWSTSAAFADVDADGDLDLYVANYVLFALDAHPLCGESESGLRSYCHPALFPGLPDRFYRNRGDGTFDDATAPAGLAGPGSEGQPAGKGLGVIFGDVDGDGFLDLYVANDTTPNFLFHNRGDGTFEDVSLFSGTAFNAEGKAEAGMGVDFGDLSGDGLPELVVTNFDMETNALYGNLGEGLFSDQRFVSRIAEPSLYRVGFGTALVDLDLDGDLDLAVANGHIIANIEVFPDKAGNTYRQPNQVLENVGAGRFEPVAAAGLEAVRSSRGLAVGDLDGDGDSDLVITNSDDEAEVYRNDSPSPGSFLALDLIGRSGNRHAIGAQVTVRSGGPESSRTQVREVRTGSSYLSQNELTLRFGLGDAAQEEGWVEAIEIRWPDGGRQVIRGLPAGVRARVVAPR